MKDALKLLPPLLIQGKVTFTISRDAGGEQRIAVMQSPMMNRADAAAYVGLGTNAFCERVSDGRITKRGETNSSPYHIDDLNQYLESLSV